MLILVAVLGLVVERVVRVARVEELKVEVMKVGLDIVVVMAAFVDAVVVLAGIVFTEQTEYSLIVETMLLVKLAATQFQ